MATTHEVATELVNLVRQGKYDEAYTSLYSPEIVSVEPGGPEPVTHGLDGVRGKAEWFNTTFEVKSAKVSDPLVNGDQFITEYNFVTVTRDGGVESNMDEYGLYTVKDGKIVEERFFFTPMGE